MAEDAAHGDDLAFVMKRVGEQVEHAHGYAARVRSFETSVRAANAALAVPAALGLLVLGLAFASEFLFGSFWSRHALFTSLVANLVVLALGGPAGGPDLRADRGLAADRGPRGGGQRRGRAGRGARDAGRAVVP